jgi:hypothetical protein
VQGHKRQLLRSRLEANGVRRPCELAIKDGRRQVGLLLDRDDELAGEPRRLHTPRVEDEDESFTVAGSTARDVGGDKAPRISERLKNEAKGAQILACLLNRNDVEAGGDLGDATQVEEISPGRIVWLRAPPLGHPAEGAEVPSRDEEVAVEMAGRDCLVKSADESVEDLGEVLRKRISDLRRARESDGRKSCDSSECVTLVWAACHEVDWLDVKHLSPIRFDRVEDHSPRMTTIARLRLRPFWAADPTLSPWSVWRYDRLGTGVGG